MREVWQFKHNEDLIEVKNNYATEMYINGKLQDQKKGIYFSTTLKGKLDGGEEVKASLGGFFRIRCTLQIGEKILYPVSVKK